MMYGKPARASHAVCEGSMIWLTHGKISGVFRLIAAIAFSSFPSMSCASSASSTPTTLLRWRRFCVMYSTSRGVGLCVIAWSTHAPGGPFSSSPKKGSAAPSPCTCGPPQLEHTYPSMSACSPCSSTTSSWRITIFHVSL